MKDIFELNINVIFIVFPIFLEQRIFSIFTVTVKVNGGIILHLGMKKQFQNKYHMPREVV